LVANFSVHPIYGAEHDKEGPLIKAAGIKAE